MISWTRNKNEFEHRKVGNCMNYISREQDGGPINSAGMSLQDCSSIVYLFKYLDKDKFKAITFESWDDFTILFDDKELRIQVKNNLFTIKFVKNLLKKYECSEDRIFIGNGFDDEFRNFHSKLLRIENAIKVRESNKQKFEEEMEVICNNHNISFNKIKKVKFDSIDKIRSVDLAKYAISEWAEKKCLFINSIGVLYELQTKISLCLREKSGFLKKQDVLDIIQHHRSSRIASNYSGELKDTDIEYIIQKLEQLILKHSQISIDLQIVKYEIENQMYVEAWNHIFDLRCFSLSAIDEIYIWLLFKNKDYKAIVEMSKEESDLEILLLGKSLGYLGRYDDAIENLNKIVGYEDPFEVYFLLAKCYKEKGKKEECILYLEKCLKLNEHKELIYFELGILYPYSKKCIEYMDKALNCNKKFALAFLEKGKVLRYFGEFQKAIKSLETYLELSRDYTNSSVLREIALSYYNNGNANNIYLNRWVDRFINFDFNKPISDGEKIAIVDIGYKYTNLLVLTKNKDCIEININKQKIAKVEYKIRSKSGIGLYISPINRWLAEFGSEEESSELDLKASMPTLFKMYDNKNDFHKTKNQLLSENVLHLNHEWEGFEEYIAEDEYISVEVIKMMNSLNAIINIGNYIIDEWIPEASEGFHSFRSKLQEEVMFNEAAIVLIAPEEICQITFCKNKIKIIDKM